MLDLGRLLRGVAQRMAVVPVGHALHLQERYQTVERLHDDFLLRGAGFWPGICFLFMASPPGLDGWAWVRIRSTAQVRMT
jgi:hypothetical protein